LRGGPRLRSRQKVRPVGRRDWIRSESIRLTVRPGELADLVEIARAWGVPLSTAAWAIVHEQLRAWRKRSVDFGESGLAIAASFAVLRRRSGDRAGGANRDPDSGIHR
jgi:hypothetical protein